MKKNIFIILTIIIPTCIVKAQVTVDEIGRLGIGTTNPTEGIVHIRKDGDSNALIFHNGDSYKTFGFYRNGNWSYIMRGDYNSSIRFDNNANLYFRSTDNSFGAYQIMAKANRVDSRLWIAELSGNHFFYVRGDGRVYHCGLYSLSDERMKENIIDIDIDEEKVKLDKLRSVSYFKKQGANFSSIPEDSVPDDFRSIKEYGLIAQEVEKIYPELVSTNEDGIKAINYLGFIPILIKTVQEQEKEINTLKTYIGGSEKLKTKSGTEIQTDNTEDLKLEALIVQNNPNPFNVETVISMVIPRDVVNAEVYIYDLKGDQKEVYEIVERNNTSIKIQANSFEPGMYLYSLLCDGKLIGTKQMIITQ